MRTLSDINRQPQQSSNMGIVTPLLMVAGLGILGYFGYKLIDKKREQEAIDKANKDALTSALNIKRTDKKISTIENKAFVNGVNANGKRVTVNITDEAKKLANEFNTKTTDKYGVTTYHNKAGSNLNSANIKAILMNTPLNSIAKLYKLFLAYTGKSFKDVVYRLSQNAQAEVQAINNSAYKFFPDTFK